MSQVNVDAIRASNGTGDAISLTASSNTCTANITNYPHRNALINGGMQVAQYASTNSAINTYGPLDRWRTMGGPMGFTITQVTDATNYPNTNYALKAHRTAGNTQEYDLGVAQGIETPNSRGFAGRECTFSFRARVGANFSGPSSVLKVIVWHGTGNNENPLSMSGQGGTTIDKTVTTTATKYSVTYTIPAGTTQITCGVYYQCRGTAGANDWFEITDCQFELGPVATDFEIRDYGYELTRCQRYYFKINPSAAQKPIVSTAWGPFQNKAQGTTFFPVEMLKDPTALEQSGTAGDYYILSGSSSETCSAVPIFTNASQRAAKTEFEVSGGPCNAGHACLPANKTTSGFLAWSAEL